jgi:DNA polymerase-3 subunit delta
MTAGGRDMVSGKTAGRAGKKAIYIICGQDTYLVGIQCERLLDSLVSPQQRAMAVWQPAAKEAQGADALDELRTLPLLAPVRIVLIKDAEPFIKANAELLEKYLDNPDPSGVLILTVNSWDKRLRLAKKVAGSDCVLLTEVAAIAKNKLPGYAADYARQRYGVKIDSQSASLLVELTGDEPGRILRQIDNLALYVHPAKSISVRDIEKLIGRDRMFNAFEVIDAVCAGQCGLALDRLRRMFEQNKDSEYTVVGAFAFHFRRLFKARTLVDKGQSPDQAALAVGVKWYREQFSRQVGALCLERGAEALCELGRIDFGNKTGQTNVTTAMERLVIQLTEIFKNL